MNKFLKAGILALIIVICAITSWELWLRHQGNGIAYDDGDMLWSDKRDRVYQPTDKATVFIGSSRIKFDLDVDLWRKLTGEDAVQLAMVGNSPTPILYDLANDKNFKGKLVIDVTEGLFFSTSPNNTSEPQKNIEYYKKYTPAQKASFRINHVLESRLVFLDKNYFSLNAFLEGLHIPDRPGVFRFPDFPIEFGRVTFDRQNKMTDRFLTDTSLQNKVKHNWEFFRSVNKEPPASGKKLDSIMMSVKRAVDKIKSRGGQVIFVRTPSSGPFWAGEQMGFPRKKYWDQLLSVTNCQGIHFEDYPAIAHFQCPEFSHLKPQDALVFTKHFVSILQDKGWTFHQSTMPQ